jgi:hypothetical protein
MSSDLMNRATPTIRIVYKHWGGRDVVAEELKKALENKDKVAEFWRRRHQQVEKDLAPYAAALADAVVSAYKFGGLEAAKEAAYKYFSKAKHGKKKLVKMLLPEASETLQHKSGAMLKFSRLPLLTCPGADVCGAQCYALHGHYSKEMVKESIMRQDAFVNLLIDEVKRRVGGDPALTAGLVGAALAGAVEAAGKAEIVRLHDAGDINDSIYAAAWMTAAKLLPNRRFYTYTKTFPNVVVKVWEDAVQYYRRLFGESSPENFAVNISATSTNFHLLPRAAEEFAKLGVQTPGVFFYAPGNMALYYRDEDWRKLAEGLVETARRTAGKKLILEIEHGLGSSRSAKSASNLLRVVEDVVNYAQSAGVALKIVVPTVAYREDGSIDMEKTNALKEVADVLVARGFSYTSAEEGRWTKRAGGRDYEMKREVVVFDVPGVGEPVEMFVEPGGEKVCTLCQRCVVAQHSPLKKEAFKIRITRDTGAQLAETSPTYAETSQRRRAGRRKKAVAA